MKLTDKLLFIAMTLIIAGACISANFGMFYWISNYGLNPINLFLSCVSIASTLIASVLIVFVYDNLHKTQEDVENNRG